MKKNSLYEFMKNHTQKETVSFHMPGHKSNEIYVKYGYGNFIDNILKYDITEINGADNLHQADGIIKESQRKFARLYGAKESFFLVNGTTSGIISAMLTCSEYGSQIIMARDSHQSVYNGAALGDLEPVYIYPQIIKDFNISGEYLPEDIEKAIEDNPQAQCVIIPYPNYYGVCSDIVKIVDLVHKHNKILIVDEAHGAHLKFSDELPICAITAGADIVINSTHKTLSSFTQSSVLHIKGNRIDEEKLKDQLKIFQSSSPSYLLMTSLDICGDIMTNHGHDIMRELIESINWFYNQFEKNDKIKIMKASGQIKYFDRTKINIDMTAVGITGKELECFLREEYDIYMEMAGLNYCMALCGIGNSRTDFEKLAQALKTIEKIHGKNKSITYNPVIYGPVEQVLKLKEVSQLGTDWINIDDCLGGISSKSVIPYPPGIPLICPGEKITKYAIRSLKKLLAEKIDVVGLNDNKEISLAKLEDSL